jgi:hypothetical protein
MESVPNRKTDKMGANENEKAAFLNNLLLMGRLHGAFSMCIFMSDKPFVAEACPPMSHGSASNGLSDIETHIENAPCNRPLKGL